MNSNDGMHRLKLVVDRELPDGRLVVVNCSREDAPIGAILTSLFAENVARIGDDFVHERVGPSIRISLKLESVEWFRKAIDRVPVGHNAAVKLSGEGLSAIKAQWEARGHGGLVVLGAM